MSLTTRPQGHVLCLFDVDGPLTVARQKITPDMVETLEKLRAKCAIGFVGGSDLAKQQEQLILGDGNVTDMFDYCFSENGLTAFKAGKQLASQSFINWIGEETYQELANFILHYIADLKIPVKRGTFIEFRNAMINVSPVGRNATTKERHAFTAYDNEHHIRQDFATALKAKFPNLGLTYSIGGQISFDVFPTGWDKTYCLRHVENEGFKEIHFFGDKTAPGGNDHEIYEDPRTLGHTVQSYADTQSTLKELFQL